MKSRSSDIQLLVISTVNLMIPEEYFHIDRRKGLLGENTWLPKHNWCDAFIIDSEDWVSI